MEARLTAVVSTKGAQKANKELNSLSKSAKTVDVNVKKTEKSFKSFGTSAARAVAAVDGPLGGISSRITAITSLAGGGQIAMAGLAVSVVAVGAALTQGVLELDKLNVALAKSEALIKATGGAAGFTATQLQEQAQALALTTLASTEQIQKAQGILQTFDKVSSETFTRAIGLAQDLATVYGGDAASQATQLGKALQDPVKGITALNRVGVTFTETQRKQIKGFVDGGEAAKAQEIILANLASQVGGAGAAVASGTLAGAFDTTGQVYTEFVAKLANSTGVYENLISLVSTFNNGLIGLSNDLDANSSDRVQELVKERQVLEAELKEFGEIGKLPIFGTLFGRSQAEAKVLTDKIKALNAEIGGIQDANKAKLKAESDAQKAGEARQEEIATRDLDAAKAAQKEKDDAKLQLQKDAAQRQLEVFTNLNNTELEAIDVKRQMRIDKIKGFLEQELILEKDFSTAKLEIERNAELERSKIAASKNAIVVKAVNDEIKADKDAGDKRNADAKQAGMALLGTIQNTMDERSAIFKAAAITETIINTYAAATGAYKALAPIPVVGPALGAAAAGVAVGAGLANVQKITAAREQGGQISAGQNVLVGERGPEIITSQTNARVLNKSQTSAAMSGGGGNQVSLVVIDQSTGGKDFSQETQDDGRIILLIRDTVGSDFQDPNSQITKGATNGLDVAVRR